MARRGAPRKVAITLAGQKPAPPPARRRSPTKHNLIDHFVTCGLLSWFAAGAARRYAGVVEPSLAPSSAIAGPVAARRLVVQEGAGQTAAAETLDAQAGATAMRNLVRAELGADAEALIYAVAVEARSFVEIARERGDQRATANRAWARTFRRACDDLARVLISEKAQKVLAKSA